jgi:hypothetical protein
MCVCSLTDDRISTKASALTSTFRGQAISHWYLSIRQYGCTLLLPLVRKFIGYPKSGYRQPTIVHSTAAYIDLAQVRIQIIIPFIYTMYALFTLFFMFATSFVGLHAQPSSTPSCFSCPPEDEAGFPLGNSDESANPIFCSYPAFSGENPTDFYCTYDPVSGFPPQKKLYTHAQYRPPVPSSRIMMPASVQAALLTIALTKGGGATRCLDLPSLLVPTPWLTSPKSCW